MSKAYRNSPISPKHKPYIAVMWNSDIYVEHCAEFGLAPSGGIQGTVADALIDVFKFHGIKDAMKWVDDFIFFRSPTGSHLSSQFIYNYDLDTVSSISSPLSIPWHPYWVKGRDFAILVNFVGLLWNCESHSVALPDAKRLKTIQKINTFLELSTRQVTRRDCASLLGTL